MKKLLVLTIVFLSVSCPACLIGRSNYYKPVGSRSEDIQNKELYYCIFSEYNETDSQVDEPFAFGFAIHDNTSSQVSCNTAAIKLESGEILELKPMASKHASPCNMTYNPDTHCVYCQYSLDTPLKTENPIVFSADITLVDEQGIEQHYKLEHTFKQEKGFQVACIPCELAGVISFFVQGIFRGFD